MTLARWSSSKRSGHSPAARPAPRPPLFLFHTIGRTFRPDAAARLAALEVVQSGIGQSLSKILSKLEQSQATLLQGDTAVLQKLERLEQSHETFQERLTVNAETMQSLTTRVGEMLVCAISAEMHHEHMTKPTDPAACQ